MNDPYPPPAAARPGRISPEISLGVSPPASLDNIDDLTIWLRDHAVEEVECVTTDFAGIGRGKVMPAAKFARATPTYLPTSLFFLTITGGYPDFEGFNAYDIDADLALRPDLATTRAVPWASDRSVQVIHDVCDRDAEALASDLSRLIRDLAASGLVRIEAR